MKKCKKSNKIIKVILLVKMIDGKNKNLKGSKEKISLIKLRKWTKIMEWKILILEPKQINLIIWNNRTN